MSQDSPKLTIQVPDGPLSVEATYQMLLHDLRNGLPAAVVPRSGLIVLRIRVGIVEGDLRPDQVRIEVGGPAGAREATFDERGNPSYWPKGLFEEEQQMYFRLRRALAAKDEPAGASSPS